VPCVLSHRTHLTSELSRKIQVGWFLVIQISSHCLFKIHAFYWEWWLTAVILATWEAEIRRTLCGDQPRQKVHKTPISANKKLGMVAHGCHPKFMGSISRIVCSPGQPGHKARPYSKNKAQRAMGVAQVIEPLSSKLKAFSSNHSMCVCAFISSRAGDL
jgi:hypothetical protein